MVYHTSNTNQKKMEVATLISHRADFSIRKCICYEEGCYKMIKGVSFLSRRNNHGYAYA